MTARPRRRGRGGKGGHEPRAHVRLREVQVLEQMLEGKTQHQIGEALGISQPAVSKIVRRVEERLLKDLAYQVDRQRARHTLRLEFIYQQAIHAWQSSKEEFLRRRQRRTDGGSGDGITVAELTSENRFGDPRYLDEARKALADSRKLWGMDAPERMAIEASTPFASMTDEALEAAIARQTRLLQQAEAPAVNPVPSTSQSPEVSDDDR